MKVILSKEAKSDIDNIYKYIARNSIKYAIENDKAIHTTIHKLEFYPYCGRYIPEFLNIIESFMKLLKKKSVCTYILLFMEKEILNHFIIHI